MSESSNVPNTQCGGCSPENHLVNRWTVCWKSFLSEFVHVRILDNQQLLPENAGDKITGTGPPHTPPEATTTPVWVWVW